MRQVTYTDDSDDERTIMRAKRASMMDFHRVAEKGDDGAGPADEPVISTSFETYHVSRAIDLRDLLERLGLK